MSLKHTNSQSDESKTTQRHKHRRHTEQSNTEASSDEYDEEEDEPVLLTAKQYLFCGFCKKGLAITGGSNGAKLTPGVTASPSVDFDIVVNPNTHTICHAGCYQSYHHQLRKSAESLLSKRYLRLLPESHQTTLLGQARKLYIDASTLNSTRFLFYPFSKPALPYAILFDLNKHNKTPGKRTPQ